MVQTCLPWQQHGEKRFCYFWHQLTTVTVARQQTSSIAVFFYHFFLFLVLLSLRVFCCDFMYILICAAISHDKSSLLALVGLHFSVVTSSG